MAWSQESGSYREPGVGGPALWTGKDHKQTLPGSVTHSWGLIVANSLLQATGVMSLQILKADLQLAK